MKPSAMDEPSLPPLKTLQEELDILVLSNFIALEVADSLNLWAEKLGLRVRLNFAPPNTIVQHLLRFATSICNYVVILLQVGRLSSSSEECNSRLLELVYSIKSYVASAPSRHVFVLCCPVPPPTENKCQFQDMEIWFQHCLAKSDRIDVATTTDLFDLYPPTGLHGLYEHSSSLEGVVYSQLGSAVLGTMIARMLNRRMSEYSKVVVVDCDNTLWMGLCAESGPTGVAIGPGNRLLQQILVRQSGQGQLIFLCSKNDEADVLLVFKQRLDMILKIEHLAGYRINWRPKAHNLDSLSREVNLALDSFLFIDDDPVECEAIRVLCPTVKVVQCPQRQVDLVQVTRQIWDFDYVARTAEDERRAHYYQENALRERIRATHSHRDFLRSLDLKVDISHLTCKELDRAVQLTRRVNQFNLNGEQQSPDQLADVIQQDNAFIVRARDRFGDYGIVGLVVYAYSGRVLTVRNLLLSCRALGKGVERYLAMHFDQQARKRGSDSIKFAFRPTGRNTPLKQFLLEIGADLKDEGPTIVQVQDLLANLETAEY